MAGSDGPIEISAGGVSLVLEPMGADFPCVAWFGPSDARRPAPLTRSTPRPTFPDIEIPWSLFPQSGKGFAGEPAILGFREESRWETDFRVSAIHAHGAGLVISAADAEQELRLELRLALDPASGILSGQTTLENIGRRDYHLQRLAALCLPLPGWVSQGSFFEGRWGDEGREITGPLRTGKFERIVRDCRPGYDWSQFFMLSEQDISENRGRAIGFHFGFSGNHQIFVERDSHAEGQAQLSEWLAPGEIRLGAGARYRTPLAWAAVSYRGRRGVRDVFHRHLRAGGKRVARPAHLNTWEGVWFAVDERTLMEMATVAAGLGFERFVLDDGWFKGRVDDRRGLGDWVPDPLRFPQGLGGLVREVNRLGMEFGLWVEPEMVSPDSDLYRKHPDWALNAGAPVNITGRNQLVLDISRPEVAAYIIEVVSGLLGELNIACLKWDFNRSLYPGSDSSGAVYHRYTHALYHILSSIRERHPSVIIETCASGGGRIDFGILAFADRVWPSDNTDAIERVRIQRSLSQFLPLEYIGAHVGPAPNVHTGRDLPMSFRCLAAMFGHFGAELDPRSLPDEDARTLRSALRFYREFREVIHGGALHLPETGTGQTDLQWIVCERSGTLLLRALNLGQGPAAVTADLGGFLCDGRVRGDIHDFSGKPGSTVQGGPAGEVALRLPDGPSGMIVRFPCMRRSEAAGGEGEP